MTPAEMASAKALKTMFSCIDNHQCFRLEAGAGAGKTYSLIEALKHIIRSHAQNLSRKNQRIACITYTNVAKNEINTRTDNNPLIYAETIHAFSWSLIKGFQKQMLDFIPTISEKWKERISCIGGINEQQVIYDLGYPSVTDSILTLHHDDVLKITSYFLGINKFRSVLHAKFPIILIDEYQDTNEELAESIVKNLIDAKSNILIGFFGDHWQKIYGSKACGYIESQHGYIKDIGMNANFRSDSNIVNVLNNMRPELTQEVSDPMSGGETLVFHTNNWRGERRKGGHWKGDLPADVAKKYQEEVKILLSGKGWDFNDGNSKILLLTNNLIAEEQGYKKLISAFYNTDDYLKKNDPYIKFFNDTIEPVCNYFSSGKYGKMFNIIRSSTSKLTKQSDKGAWKKDIEHLIQLRKTSSISEVIEYLQETNHPRLSPKIEAAEARYINFNSLSDKEQEEEKSFYEKLTTIKEAPYSEMIALSDYIEKKSPFSTKHGVKGAQFENVLIVLGRGWNHYNWNQVLEWFHDGVPKDKSDTFERNRNLLYVSYSRARKKLVILFTQELSETALFTLESWFNKESITGLENINT